MTRNDLLELLVCPVCHGGLTREKDGDELVGLGCAACGTVYPVRGGIPVMLADQAVPRTLWDNGARGVDDRDRGGKS